MDTRGVRWSAATERDPRDDERWWWARLRRGASRPTEPVNRPPRGLCCLETSNFLPSHGVRVAGTYTIGQAFSPSSHRCCSVLARLFLPLTVSLLCDAVLARHESCDPSASHISHKHPLFAPKGALINWKTKKVGAGHRQNNSLPLVNNVTGRPSRPTNPQNLHD